MDRNNSYLFCYFWYCFSTPENPERELCSYCAALPLVIEASMNAGVEMDEHPVIDGFGCTPPSYHNGPILAQYYLRVFSLAYCHCVQTARRRWRARLSAVAIASSVPPKIVRARDGGSPNDGRKRACIAATATSAAPLSTK